jgi:hypothetical protein
LEKKKRAKESFYARVQRFWGSREFYIGILFLVLFVALMLAAMIIPYAIPTIVVYPIIVPPIEIMITGIFLALYACTLSLYFSYGLFLQNEDKRMIMSTPKRLEKWKRDNRVLKKKLIPKEDEVERQKKTQEENRNALFGSARSTTIDYNDVEQLTKRLEQLVDDARWDDNRLRIEEISREIDASLLLGKKEIKKCEETSDIAKARFAKHSRSKYDRDLSHRLISDYNELTESTSVRQQAIDEHIRMIERSNAWGSEYELILEKIDKITAHLSNDLKTVNVAKILQGKVAGILKKLENFRKEQGTLWPDSDRHGPKKKP